MDKHVHMHLHIHILCTHTHKHIHILPPTHTLPLNKRWLTPERKPEFDFWPKHAGHTHIDMNTHSCIHLHTERSLVTEETKFGEADERGGEKQEDMKEERREAGG